MKKNISINISGIIFHIEEDGYEALRQYLDSINKYFSQFDGSSEILSDIESRIAEIFLTKLNEGKQVITEEDVRSLMVTMGSVTDFKAAEEQETEPIVQEKKTEARSESKSTTGTSTPPPSFIPPKKLMRDSKRKILGGVCAGLGHYLNLDPVWPRVIFALLVLGTYGIALIPYIILWIVLPESWTLDEQTATKKMYRNTDRKVLGGVAAGIAAFTGVDTTLIRVLFVVTGFFFFGIVAYIIFWVALPEAKTITEKMEMQGEPVTLSNIESSVKKNLNEKEGQEESLMAKIILFPFRAIAAVFGFLGKTIGPVLNVFVDVVRILIGVSIVLTALALIFSLLVGFGIVGGLMTTGSFPDSWNMQFLSFPFQAIQNTISGWTIFFGFMAFLVPALFMFLLGISAMAKRLVFKSPVGWTLFAVFFISVAALSIQIPRLAFSFKERGEVRVEKIFPMPKGTLYLNIREVGLDDYDVTNIRLYSHKANEIKIVQCFEAQGNTRKAAAENAKTVDYEITQQDSLLWFDSNITFKPGAEFRAQRLRIHVFLPENSPFIVDEKLMRLVNNVPGRYVSFTETYKFKGEDLECTTCQEDESGSFNLNIDIQDDASEPPATPDTEQPSKLLANDQYGLEGFSSVDISGILDVTIEQGDTYAVDLGKNKTLREDYEVYMDGETLVISYEDKRTFFWNNKFWNDHDEIKITITMPHLEDLSMSGAGKVSLRGFDEQEMNIDLTGAISGNGDIRAGSLSVGLTGASHLDIAGGGSFLDANITGASGLKAYGYEVERAVIEAHGASTARVNVTQTLEMRRGYASSISFRGNPNVVKR